MSRTQSSAERAARNRERYQSDPEYREKVKARNQAWREANRDKIRDSSREYYQKNVAGQYDREARRKSHVKNTYGLSLDEIKRAEVDQEGRCAICRSEVKLHIDHDHETGKFRGLLCGPCNRGLGMFKDNPDLLISSAAYLLQQGQTTTSQE